MRRACLFASLALLVTSASGAAQLAHVVPDTTHHVLQMPAAGQPLLCHELRALPDSLRARGFSLWEFAVGNATAGPIAVRPREITVAFDSAGGPIVFIDMVTLVPIRTDQVALQFFRGREPVGEWRAVRFDSASVARMEGAVLSGGRERIEDAIPPAQVRAVSAAEQEQARALIRWLWDRRCPSR